MRLRATGPAKQREGAWEDLLPPQWRPKPAMNSNSTTTPSSSSSPSSTTAPPATSHPVYHPAHALEEARNCTLTECTRFHCNASVPFVCVDGFALGGCAPSANAWQNAGCSSYCSLKHCHSEVPKCGGCSDADCHRLRATCGTNELSDARLCFNLQTGCSPIVSSNTPQPQSHDTGSRRHFACTAGPSNGGCSANSTYWPEAVLTGQCQSCCDLSQCPKPLECAKSCTPFECEQVCSSSSWLLLSAAGDARSFSSILSQTTHTQVGECPASKSFACTKGAAARGCGTASFWEAAIYINACEACCDTASCP